MNELSLDVKQIEAALKPLQRKCNIGMVLMRCSLIFFVFIFVSICTSNGNAVNGGLIMLCFVGMICFMIGGSLYYHFARKTYVKEYKNVLAIPVLESMFEEVRYDPERGFAPLDFQIAKLIKWRSDFRYQSEDLIEGVHRGIAFRQADVRIKHTTGSGKNRRTVVDVDGRIWCFDCPRQVASNVLIVKNFTHAALEYGLNKVEMEDVDFNKKFEVYAKDAHSAFYVLTPHFMEYVKSLYKHDWAVYISFDGEKLYFLQSGKGGIFEPSDAKVDVTSEIEKVRRELQVIDTIIDVLKIDKA